MVFYCDFLVRLIMIMNKNKNKTEILYKINKEEQKRMVLFHSRDLTLPLDEHPQSSPHHPALHGPLFNLSKL